MSRTAFPSVLLFLSLLPPTCGFARTDVRSGGDVVAVPAPRIIVLARHGHYVADLNADARLGPGLSPLGIAQAKLLGARLAGLSMPFDVIAVSPLTRAQETARVVAADLPEVKRVDVPELAECTPPTRRSEVVTGMPAEALEACARQLDKLFAERFRPASGKSRHELMVCHGNVIRYLITKAMAVDSKAWLELSVGHTSLTTIRVEADGSFRVIAAGDIGHLPANFLTGATGDPERTLVAPTLQ